MFFLNRFIKIFLFCACFFVSAQASYAASEIVVSKIRFGQHGEMTRVVLEYNKPIKAKHFLLPEPARYVLDFPEVKFTADMEHLKFPEGGLIKGVRQGLFKPGVTRFVIDLEKASVATVFTMLTMARLVGDVRSSPFI